MKPTTEAYLHVIRGGFDENLRKKVRKVFSSPNSVSEEKETIDDSDFDFVVGILEEIHAVGVRRFTVDHIYAIAKIFDLGHISIFMKPPELTQALMILGVPNHGIEYYTPTESEIERILKRYCHAEQIEYRKINCDWKEIKK